MAFKKNPYSLRIMVIMKILKTNVYFLYLEENLSYEVIDTKN